jgi:hemoglobin
MRESSNRALHRPGRKEVIVTSSLYDDAGGTDGLRRLSNAFYQRVLADELLAPVFVNFTTAHVGHHALLGAHLGLKIRDEHRQRWLRLMADAISEVLPGRPELATALMGYFEWGTAIAKDVSQDPAGTDLGKPGPTPRWGYQGLVSAKA